MGCSPPLAHSGSPGVPVWCGQRRMEEVMDMEKGGKGGGMGTQVPDEKVEEERS